MLKALDGLTQEELDALPDRSQKAEFFSEGTAEDYVEQEREDTGMADWYRRLRDL